MLRFLPKIFGFLLGFLAVYCWWLEPCRLSVTRHDVADPENPLKTPIRLLLLTDWHLGRFTRSAALKAKMERLAAQHRITPFDVILLGGDYVDVDRAYLPMLKPCLETLMEFGLPIFAVLGNHDHTSFPDSIEIVMASLQECGVHVLRNEAQSVTVRGQPVLIVGMEDLQEAPTYYHPERYQSPSQYKVAAEKIEWYRQFDSVEVGTPRVLLAHNPDAVYLPGRNPSVVLSGHTHGGQMMLLDWISRPLHRWLHVHLPPGSAVTRAGRRTVSGRALIVSRGIEGSAVPLRLLRPPEAIVVVLH